MVNLASGIGDVLPGVREGHAMDAAVLVLHEVECDALSSKQLAQFIPSDTFLHGSCYLIIEPVLDGILAFQTFTSNLVLPLAKGQTISTGQCFGDSGRLCIAGVTFNATSLIIHSVIDDVDMRVWLVVVTEYHILGILDTHAPHVFFGYFSNLLVIEFVIVIRRETERYVSNKILDTWTRFCLCLEACCYSRIR